MRFVATVFLALCAVFALDAFAEDAPSNAFTLTTDAFLDQGALPVLYTCDGKDVSPQLSWTNVPAKTQALALVVKDPDAPNGDFYHWVVYNIPTSAKELAQGTKSLPSGALAGKNSWNKLQYNGPCPPKGSAHTYTITLYALSNKLTVPTGADAKAVIKAISSNTVGKAELTMVYSRWLQ